MTLKETFVLLVTAARPGMICGGSFGWLFFGPVGMVVAAAIGAVLSTAGTFLIYGIFHLPCYELKGDEMFYRTLLSLSCSSCIGGMFSGLIIGAEVGVLIGGPVFPIVGTLVGFISTCLFELAGTYAMGHYGLMLCNKMEPFLCGRKAVEFNPTDEEGKKVDFDAKHHAVRAAEKNEEIKVTDTSSIEKGESLLRNTENGKNTSAPPLKLKLCALF
jgi:hypothetical protein